MFRPVCLSLFCLLVLNACASVSVRSAKHQASPERKPVILYVQDFDAPAGVFRVDRGGDAFVEFRAALAQRLTEATVVRLEKKQISKASRVSAGAQLPRQDAWLVTGEFLRVNQGSRILRATVGLGLGGTKLETRVHVYDLRSHKPRLLLTFETTGGSNSQPGAAAGLLVPNWWLLSLDTVVRLAPGLNADTIRTSRQIVAVLSEYKAKEGMLPDAQIYRSKKLGKWP